MSNRSAPGIQPVFLLSLPRSGSTLLQRLLEANPEISTAPEPWFLLPILSGLREDAAFADYGHRTATRAISDFLAAIPDGRQAFVAATRRWALDLYAAAAHEGERYFLDKTPRYHFILPELFEVFPDAKFVFLWRNPLAVLASVLGESAHWNVYQYDSDLIDGWRRLLAFQRTLPTDRFCAVNYERMVRDPQHVLDEICAFLEIPPCEASLTSPDRSRTLTGRMGDHRGSREYSDVSAASVDRWRRVLANGPRRRWARSYLKSLGSDALAESGYDLGQLLEQLESIPTSRDNGMSDRLWQTYGLAHKHLDLGILRRRFQQLQQGARSVAHT